MLIAIDIILIGGILIVSLLSYQCAVRISAMIAQIKQDAQELQDLRIDESQSLSHKPEYRVAVEVIDPVALARRESKLAWVVAGVAPDYITREVYKHIQEEIALAMEERGIDASITLFKL